MIMKKTAHKKIKSVENTQKTSTFSWVVPLATAGIVIALILGGKYLKGNMPKQTTEAPKAPAAQVLPSNNLALPAPDVKSGTSLEAALKNRRSYRTFTSEKLTLKQVSQMLWAAQGVTVDWGGRTAPSSKSVYPLTVYLIASKVDGLDAGEYQYIPGDRKPVHELKPIKKVDLQDAIFKSINQNSFKDVPAVLIITGNMGKMSEAFGGAPADKAVYLEAGHAAQNLYLEAESLKIGMVVNGSFNDASIRGLVTIPANETIIYMVPMGIPKN